MRTSGDVLAGTFASRSHSCGDHGFTQSKIRDAWWPLVCPTCHPPERPDTAAGRPKEMLPYAGDILEDLHAAGVNAAKYRDATLDAFDGSDDPAAAAAARSYLANWRHGRFVPRDWMYFYGTGSERGRQGVVSIGRTGNGKTFLAVAIARWLIEASLLNPRRFGFATAETILLESEATFRTNADDSEIRLLRRYEQLDLLVIDDVGVRDLSPHAVRLFDELTKRRECRATIWTSNLSLRVLAGGPEYLRRITSRIAGECGDGGCYVVEFCGPDRRIQRSRRSSAA